MTDNMSMSIPEAIELLQKYLILPESYSPIPLDWSDVKKLVLSNTEDRLVIFDSECIENDEDYSGLLPEFVSATKNEWQLQNTQSKIDWKLNVAVLEFDSFEKHHVWKMRQTDDYVSDDFILHLERFADRYLSGAFCVEESDDQIATFRYLPKEVIDLIEEIDVRD